MALDIFTSFVIIFLPLILCSQAQHFFCNLKEYMCVHTCAHTYIHTCTHVRIHTSIHGYETFMYFFISLSYFSLGQRSWRVAATPRGSKRCMGSVIATWPVCDGTSVGPGSWWSNLLLLAQRGLFGRSGRPGRVG